jgi:hypothetical protein
MRPITSNWELGNGYTDVGFVLLLTNLAQEIQGDQKQLCTALVQHGRDHSYFPFISALVHRLITSIASILDTIACYCVSKSEGFGNSKFYFCTADFSNTEHQFVHQEREKLQALKFGGRDLFGIFDHVKHRHPVLGNFSELSNIGFDIVDNDKNMLLRNVIVPTVRSIIIMCNILLERLGHPVTLKVPDVVYY